MMKEEFEKLKKKHHEFEVCREEAQVIEVQKNHVIFGEDDFRENDDIVRFFT